MEHTPCGSRPSRKANAEWFTGEVWQDVLAEAPEPARIRGLLVHFAPGARTNWHSHPLGQSLYVVSGFGRAQSWGGPIVELRPGDMVWFAPGEKHWHGAAPDSTMAHIAMQEAVDGRTADWAEPVSDAQYLG